MAETIKEFLVALGFKVDEDAFKKFDSAIVRSTGKVAVLGSTAIATSAAVQFAVERIARQLEDLYFAAQRSNTTVANLKTFQFAMGQIGIGADAAAQQVAGLARSLRLNPGVEGLIRNLGVQTREANGELRDSTKIIHDLVSNFRKMPFYLAAQFAQLLGIDADALLMMEKNFDESEKAGARFTEMLKRAGLNLDDPKWHDFMVRLREVESDLGLLAILIAQALLPVARVLLDLVDGIAKAFIDLDKATGGWSSTLIGLVGALGAAKTALWAIRALLRLFGIGVAAEAAGGAAAAAGGAAVATGGAAAAATGAVAAGTTAFAWPVGIAYGLWLALRSKAANQNEAEDLKRALGAGGASGGSEPLGIRSNNPLNLMPGGHEKVFGSAYDGVAAGVGNIVRLYRGGVDTLAKLAEAWAPAKAGNNVGAYIADLVGKTGFAANQALNLTDPAVLGRLIPAMIGHENGKNPYSGDFLRSAIAGGLATSGAPTVTISQKTDIHVTGAGDPHSAAQEIANSQTRVNGDLVRNAAGAVR